MKKTKLPVLMMLLFSTGAFAQKNFFQPVNSAQLLAAREAAIQVKNKGVYRLNEKAMRTYLLSAPIEFRNNGVTLPLEIPLPDGKTETFNMVESPILSAKVAADHPEIKTYSGNGTINKKAVIRLSLTSSGFNAIIMNVGDDAVYFEAYSKSQPDTYFNYFTKDVIIPKGMRVQTGGQDFIKTDNFKNPRAIAARPNDPPLGGIGTGTTLTTFRLALAGDGLFVQHNGGTVASAFNAIVAYVNRVNAFYRNELSVGFTLVSGTNIVFPDPGTDPYNNVDQSLQLLENQTVCDNIIGSANYDIGHVMGYIGSTGGGLAALGAVCDNTNKAQGLSFEGDPATITQVINDKLIFHEIGHQFGMNHSYNSSVPVCTSRNVETSVEPGAGITVMSYAMICFDNDFDVIGDDYYLFMFPENRALLQFHNTNYQEAVAFMQTIQPYPAGVVVTNTGNTPPVVIMPPGVTIPKSTPFALTGSATDINGDALTYDWEGTDTGGDEAHPPDASTLTNTAVGPFSRTYAPANTPTRIFPIIDSILNGSNNARADKLPSVSTTLHYNLTVRDNNPAGGGVSYGSVTVNVNGNIGPFLETTNLSGTYAGNSTKTITWSVKGTNTATPKVKISLSTDGGFTFPTVLAESTPNDGSETITLPNITTSTARIKVEAVGNIFFDISNKDFAITPAAGNYTITASAGANGTISPSGAISVAGGSSKTFTITPDGGFAVQDVKVDGSSAGPVTSYTFNSVVSNHTIYASFKTATGCTPPTLSAVVTPVSCKGGSTGSINLTTAGGSSPFTYKWTGPNGFSKATQDISGLRAGTYQVVVKANGGCTSQASYSVAAGATTPAAPFIIGQSYNLCGGGTFTFFVYPPEGSTKYTWTVPAGFTILSGQGTWVVRIKVPAGFTTQSIIKVSASNSCGTSPQSSLTVYAVAGNLSTIISGPANVTSGQKNVQYSLPFCSAFTYTWIAPPGATITSGQGTSNIKVKFGSTGGYVKVTVKNKCGSSPQAGKYVSVGSTLAATQSTLPDEASSAKVYFRAYPNPVISNTTLMFSSLKNNGKFEIRVSDISGKTLFARKGVTIAGENRLQFDMAKYASGMYLVTLITDDQTQTLKLVK